MARPDQLPPPGDWLTWLLLGGRGAGKTRAGAEWVRGMALGQPPFADSATGPIALVGETFADVREVMIEGVSGLLAHPRACDRPLWQPTRRRLVWPNGVVAQAFSSEDPEGAARTAIRRRLGATSWPNGGTPRRPGTCCSSGCASARGRARW